jgi:hypothetical protein
VLAIAALAIVMCCSDAWGIEYKCLTQLPGGSVLYLVRGIGRQSYWPSGLEGKTGEIMGKGGWKGRVRMNARDGDWCLFLVEAGQGDSAIAEFSKWIGLEIVLADGHMAESDEVVAVNGPEETEAWSSLDTPIVCCKGCPYGRTKSGMIPLYVRFPANSCLTNKGDEKERLFRSSPVAVKITRR